VTTKTTIIAAGLMLAAALSGCTESRRARDQATFKDKPADITCWTYGTQSYQGRSTGKVSNRDGGIAFVDAANGRYTVVDGECRLVYDK
jgi:outer membrane lipoprotein-sorting protein